MATAEHQQAEFSRYGHVSSKSQATQTLPLQTQIPTQTVSHELHQFTQLINHEIADHGGGDTLVNDTDSEGSGNTVVLNDDDDGDDNVHGVAESGPSLGARAALDPHSAPSGPADLIHGRIAPHCLKDLPHSDATTEEGDVRNMGNLDADAESQPSHFDATADSTGVNSGGKPSEIVRQGVVSAKQNLALQKAPEADLVADTTGGKKSSQKRRPSIASVRAESLHASGLRAISRSVSLGSAGKEDGNLDSDGTGELTHRKFPGGSMEPLEAAETELENLCAKKREGSDSMPSSPNATLVFNGTMVRSPCLSTSRLKRKLVSNECVPQQFVAEQEHIDAVDTIESERDMHEGLPRSGHAMPVVNLRQPSSQKARKLVFDCIGMSPARAKDKVEPAQGSANAEAVGPEHDYVLKKPMADALAKRERLCSLPSGAHASSTNLSYLESQEPGEESQANALNVVDKLVWLDATCMSDDVVTSPTPQESSMKFQVGANGRQSLVQAAQMKTVHDKLDVFDWEDSQADEAVSPQQVPASTKSLKRHAEALESSDRKKRVTNDQQKIETTLHVDKTGNDSRAKSRTYTDVGNIEVTNMEASIINQAVKPHIRFATRLRNMKAESVPSSKGIKSQGLKTESKKDNKHKDESVMELEPGQQRGGDDREGKVQQASLGTRIMLKKKAHESGEVLETGKQKVFKRKGSKLQHTDSLSAKAKRTSNKRTDVGTQCEGYVAVVDRASEADAAADIWIDAFTNNKNKTAAGSDMEVNNFEKRATLHGVTSGDLKKSRTTQPAIAPCNKELHTMIEKEASLLKEDRLKSGPSIQQATNGINAATIPQNKDRRVRTRFFQEDNKEIEKAEYRMEEQSTFRTEQRSKMPRNADDTQLSQVQGRRISTRNSLQEHQSPSKAEHKQAEEAKSGEPKIRSDPNESGIVDAKVICGDKSRRVKTRGGAGHLEPENVMLDAKLERGPNTRARAQDAQSVLIATNVKEFTKARKATIKTRRTKAAPDDIDESSLPRGALQGDDDTHKPCAKLSSSKKKDITWPHQNMMTFLPADAHDSEVSPTLAALAKECRKSKKRRVSSNINVPESSKAEETAGSRFNDSEKDECSPKISDVDCRRGDASSTVLLRKTRSSLCDRGSQNYDPVDIGEGNVRIQCDPTTEKQSLQNHVNSLDARKKLSKQVAKLSLWTRKSIKSSSKYALTHEMLHNVFDEGRRRKRESGCIYVLFSHSLTEETIKHQKKILAKLGGHLAKSASDCTHFVSNGFTRSQNMLLSIAAGKEVVTTLWLENCGQACYFVDEKAYILQDVKKERELGFSMMSSLASARRKPLLKGFNVLVCPNTVPEPAVLKAIVEGAGGQVVDVKSWHSHLLEKESDTPFIVIGNEKEADFCAQFLGKDLKVYSEELLLHGVVTQTLDYSRYHLFENIKRQKGRRRASSTNA